MAHDPLGCDDCPVRDVAVCAGLGERERQTLARLGRRRTIRRGETLFLAGEDNIACATLVSGALKLARIDSEGVERIVALVHPADFMARMFATAIDCTATALADSEICLFPRDVIAREMQGHAAFLDRLLRATSAQLDRARDLIDLIGRRDARARVAGLLLMFLESACIPARPGDVRRIDLPLTRGEMAALLGLTIETVSRQLTALEAMGAVRRIGLRGLEVTDPDALRTAATG
ncbi:helix-turn-helix domain-containing protein [Sphingomonas changnyeongensis]|uniref:Helix-turn-helix domain-containing protein n=1 Tax=Sphingomonas changnyeongensis TaxID=2698679 RepID=A0A7Z2S9S3_9SPHN|nr:Crp/Fnr family transcriptional regulator [Sphingomonas changnyeongensis]QHL91064.1 helix-turn-helix domain-containing protein [Sphingomonas changnyeongensis]